MYGGEKSDDAIRREHYRGRNKNAFESQVVHQRQSKEEGKEITEMGNGTMIWTDTEKRNKKTG